MLRIKKLRYHGPCLICLREVVGWWSLIGHSTVATIERTISVVLYNIANKPRNIASTNLQSVYYIYSYGKYE